MGRLLLQQRMHVAFRVPPSFEGLGGILSGDERGFSAVGVLDVEDDLHVHERWFVVSKDRTPLLPREHVGIHHPRRWTFPVLTWLFMGEVAARLVS